MVDRLVFVGVFLSNYLFDDTAEPRPREIGSRKPFLLVLLDYFVDYAAEFPQ